jgi:hypothetical protein
MIYISFSNINQRLNRGIVTEAFCGGFFQALLQQRAFGSLRKRHTWHAGCAWILLH